MAVYDCRVRYDFAILLLTTDCAIAEIKEKKDKAPAGGGMDEMDY